MATDDPRILLATSADWPELFADDQLLRDALLARGIDARPAIWDDPAVRWDEADLVVLRSIWDYTRGKRDAFVRWAYDVERQRPLHNPARVVEWNSHKSYLRTFAAHGIPVVPTEWLDAGSSADASAIARARGWNEMVAKPCVSAGARNTARGDAAAIQSYIDAMLPAHDLMIQPYLSATESIGEHSLVHFGGELSHAVRKDPALVVADYSSSSVVPVEPHPDELRLAARVLEFTGWLLYARIDCIVLDGVAHVMEAELIEPQLFFRDAPGTADRLADRIVAMLP